jgi:hypothetical protein
MIASHRIAIGRSWSILLRCFFGWNLLDLLFQQVPRCASISELFGFSTGEIAATQDGQKLGIIADVVPLGIYRQKNEVYVVGVKSSFQPLKARIAFTESRVHERYRSGRYVSLVREAF